MVDSEGRMIGEQTVSDCNRNGPGGFRYDPVTFQRGGWREDGGESCGSQYGCCHEDGREAAFCVPWGTTKKEYKKALENGCLPFQFGGCKKFVFVKPRDKEPSTENLLNMPRGINIDGETLYCRDNPGSCDDHKNYFTALNVNRYNFETGIWSNDQGEKYKNGERVE